MALLQENEVVEWAERLLGYRSTEMTRLDRIFNYLKDPDLSEQTRTLVGTPNGPLRWLNKDVPNDVKRLAEMARVNMLKFVVDATVQVMYVDGYRAPRGAEEEPIWDVWQRNGMDARQIGVHRSALSYGVSYLTVLPGDPVPVLRGVSPRRMTAVYGGVYGDDEWPALALEKRKSTKKETGLYRLFDDMNAYWVEVNSDGKASLVATEQHNVGHVPVIRFRTSFDDDGTVCGDVEPLIPIQDQINVTTFGLLVAQQYGAFRQRYIMGWAASSETEALSASAKKLWTFEDPEVQVGEFAQTDLSGYINSREASLRHLATVSQTPAHELLGQLANLSAEALAAAEANHRRKVMERETTFGEAWEQALALAAKLQGEETDPAAFVRWRDTEARSMSQTADALTKLVQGLGIPPQELWDKVPGVSQQEVDRWKAVASQADAITQLNDTLTRQATPPAG